MKKLIKNGMICTESQVFPGDILIEGAKIKAVGTGLADPDAEVIDASGKYVLPGQYQNDNGEPPHAPYSSIQDRFRRIPAERYSIRLLSVPQSALHHSAVPRELEKKEMRYDRAEGRKTA